jgi:hypothetical protein
MSVRDNAALIRLSLTTLAMACLATACGDNVRPSRGEVVVSPITGLVTTEAGGQATFTIVLTSPPAADVSIDLASSNPAEGVSGSSSVTFTRDNWNAPQTITVTGVDDDVADGAHVYTIVTGAAASTDLRYDAVDPDDVAVSNTDDETPGVTVTPVTGLTTTESGGTATFDVVLDSRPTATVEIGLVSSDLGEGTVGPANLTFTSDNWNAPQHVTVTGVDDDLADGPQTYTIQTAAAVSTDPGYSGLDAADVTVSNTDNDTAGITVTPTSGLVTDENGAQATFTIVLDAQPVNDVTIDLDSNDLTEGTASPTSVTFTALNWNAAQTITVTGVNDNVADGSQFYAIVTAAATSTDSGYSGIDPANVGVINTDNDSPGITVTPVSGLVTDESGAQATFTVVLNSQPTAAVTIGLSSSDTTEGTIDASSITFTTTDWNAPQMITITGHNDDVADGNQPYSIITAAAVSGDTGYNTVDAADVSVTNTDNDSAGIVVTPTSGLVTTEAGGQATFTIVLASQPTAAVTIPLASSDTTEGTVGPASVTFTTTDWNAPQTVTVTGIDDFIADGAQSYSIITSPATSTDSTYANLDAANVTATNTDNDSAGITVTPTSGLVTSESGGQATFTIVLASQPTADVTIPLASNDTTEGTVAPISVTFTAVNWNAPQTVTVTGVDDAVADGSQPYKILTAAAVSADPGYAGRDASDVSLNNTDNDTAGITVTPTTGLVTDENGAQATFTIVLNSQPTMDVTIGLSSNDTSEGTVGPTIVTFTSVNWNAPQTVTVTGADDLIADGNQPYKIITAPALSADPSYGTRDASDVSVTNTDNDTAGITVSPSTGLTTTEGGGQATFTVVLNSQPTGTVTIGLTSTDTTEGTVSPSTVVFTTANWDAPQTVTVTGKDDAIADGNQPYQITTAPAISSDPTYAGRDAIDVSLTNTDNDTAGITVTPTTGLVTTEAGGQATFTIVLNSQPTANVTIGLTSNDIGEGTPSTSSLVFTNVNWNAPQTITVTGIDDAFVDGNQPYKIITAPAVSADGGYASRDAADVSLTNTDNDTAGILVNPRAGLTTSEAGASATYAIVLQSQPLFDVTVPISTSDASEGTVSPTSVTFTPVNWSSPQIITIHGIDDAVADGNQVYPIVNGTASSSDPAYNGIDPDDVLVTNTDNDSPGISVTPTSGLTTTESGGQATFSIVLSSQPTASVTIGLSSSDTTEGTVALTSVTFTAANWSSAQTVTITGINDAVADGNQPYTIVTAPATSADTGYSGFDASDVAVSNIDNDSATIIVTPTTGLVTTEGGQVDVFTVVLGSQPTVNVTINLSSNDTTEGDVFPAALVFTPANWNVSQTVNVTGVDDAITDGNQVYKVITAPAISGDAGYSGLDAADVSVTNLDNEIPGFTLDPTSGLFVSEFGDFDTFTIVLNTQPTANVTISMTSTDTTEGTVGPASVTFTPANWNLPQTVTVTGVNDNLADGSQTFLIVTGAAVSTDVGYSGLNPPDIDVTNFDNDTPAVYVKARHLLKTSEQGMSSTIRVSLTTQPTANVTCTFTSSDTTEGTVAPATLIFTPANFATLQNVTVNGVDDTINDGDQLYSVLSAPCTSADPSYNGFDPRDIAVINRDND